MSGSSTNASPGPSRRRQRTSSPRAPAKPTRSESWWFEDGNVLLQAEDTLFKVHKGVIARAEVFKDMLEVGSYAPDVAADSTSSERRRERQDESRLPSVRLTDRARDVDVFLRALYDGISFVEKRLTIPDMRTLLLLADKYNHPAILSVALQAYKTSVADHRLAWLEQFRFDENRPSRPKWDQTLFPLLEDAIFALVAIAVEVSVDVKDELQSLYALLADVEQGSRANSLHHEFELDGWSISLDRQSLKEILSRIDRAMPIMSRLQAATYNSRHVHAQSCQAASDLTGTRGCRKAMKALVHAILHSDHALFTPASCLRMSVGFAIFRVRGGSDACTTGGGPTRPEPACLELLRQVWRDGLKEYEIEMAKGCERPQWHSIGPVP